MNRWIRLVGAVVAMTMISNLQYAWTLFVNPIVTATHWKLSDVQWGFSIFVALETWIGRHTRYTTDIPPLAKGQDAVTEFLFGNRRGYCEQISTALAVMLRGTLHAATAEPDGSYSLQTPDLRLPGPAAVQFEVTQGAAREVLSGTLEGQHGGQSDDRGNTRQLGWWVLNFAVCIGFLLLWSRRKSAKSADT